MPDAQVHAPHYPTVEFVLGAVAGWINKYRQASSLHDELGHCSPEDVMQIAKDLGVPVSELRKLATKGPGAADLIKKMLIALRVDPHVLANTNPAVMRDCNGCALSAAKKVVANMNWPKALLPNTCASFVRTRLRSMRCSNKKIGNSGLIRFCICLRTILGLCSCFRF